MSSRLILLSNFIPKSLANFSKYSFCLDVAQTEPFNDGIPVPLFLSNIFSLFSLILNTSLI
jgi:hypothetical protein